MHFKLPRSFTLNGLIIFVALFCLSTFAFLEHASISIGACFMVLVDTLCRSVTAGEIPLGIVTAIVGGPFFIWLLKKTKGGSWQ